MTGGSANHTYRTGVFLRFLERSVGDRDIAEDLLQAAFGWALERLDSVRENESVVAWFERVLRNAVIDHYRRSDATRRAVEAFARDLDEMVPPEDVHDAICECVTALAQTLKPEYAEALRRIDVEGAPVKEFAARVSISTGNAGVRVFRARETLRKQVVASCGTCAEHGCVTAGAASPTGDNSGRRAAASLHPPCHLRRSPASLCRDAPVSA